VPISGNNQGAITQQ